MKFEEDFPSLKGEECAIWKNEELDYTLFTQGKIIAHCIDKQRVREAIIKSFEKGSHLERQEIKENLRNELGV